MKKVIISALFSILFGAFSPGLSAKETVIQLRLYEGLREDVLQSSEVISAYHLNQSPRNLDESNIPISKERNSLKRIFNLQDVKLIAYGNLSIDLQGKQTGSQFFVHNKKNFTFQLSAIVTQSDQFQIRVIENNKKSAPLLETKIIIPSNKTAVIGFEDSDKNIYFISFFRLSGKGSLKKISEKSYEKPELIKKVNPHYPEKAKEQGIQGMEVLQARIDENGNIISLEPVLTTHPFLNHSAMVAIKQWKYTPGMVSGKSTPVPLTVMVNFMLEGEARQPIPGKVDFTIDTTMLRFLNRVAPIYPAEALKKNIEGRVIMMAFVDRNGYVSHTKVFKGNPLLAKAAETAMKQWRFEPYRIRGKRQSILFAVEFTFNIRINSQK